MPAPERVAQWVTQNYPRPAIDPDWLSDCCDWIASEHGLSPSLNFQQFIQHVESQLLQSNLEDSTVPGTGLDPRLVTSLDQSRSRAPSSRSAAPRSRLAQKPPREKTTTGPTPLLVEIRSITEIAHSAFGLLNTHQTRLDRADLGLAQDTHNPEQDPATDEDEGPIPSFPRGMLKFELSDGNTLFRAIEYRPLPDFELGVTPLGYKMLLKQVPIRNGIALLESSNVTCKGYRTEDHDIHSEEVFLRGLRKRLGRPEPTPEENQGRAQSHLVHAPPPPRAEPPQAQMRPLQAAQLQPDQVATGRARAIQPSRGPSPPVDLDDMYADDDIDPDVLMGMEINTLPTNAPLAQQGSSHGSVAVKSTSGVKPAPVSDSNVSGNHPPSSSSTLPPTTAHKLSHTVLKASPYFSEPSTSIAKTEMIPDIGLSPVRNTSLDADQDFDITWDSDEGDVYRRKNGKIESGTSANAPSTNSSHVRPNASTSVAIAKPQGLIKSESNPSKDLADIPDSSPDLLPLDMDVDEDFFAQIERIERGEVAKGKGPGRDVHPSPRKGTAPGMKTTSKTGQGTKSLDLCPISPGARPGRIRSDSISSARSTRTVPRPPPSTQPPPSLSSSLARPPSVDTKHSVRPPPSTQVPRRRPQRDPSIIVISSCSETEDEGSTFPEERKLRAVGGATASSDPGTTDKARTRATDTNNTNERVDIDIIDLSD